MFMIFKKLQENRFNQSDASRAQSAVMIISIFELMNLMSLLPETFRRKAIVVPIISLLIANGFIFLLNSRYKAIVSKKYVYESIYKPIAFIYFIGTIVWFAISHDAIVIY